MMTTQDHLSRRLPCYPTTTRIEQDECHPPERYRLGVQGVEPLYAQSVTSPNMDSMASDRVRKRPHRRHSAQGITASLTKSSSTSGCPGRRPCRRKCTPCSRNSSRCPGRSPLPPTQGPSRFPGDSSVPVAEGTHDTAACTSIAHTCDFHAEISS